MSFYFFFCVYQFFLPLLSFLSFIFLAIPMNSLLFLHPSTRVLLPYYLSSIFHPYPVTSSYFILFPHYSSLWFQSSHVFLLSHTALSSHFILITSFYIISHLPTSSHLLTSSLYPFLSSFIPLFLYFSLSLFLLILTLLVLPAYPLCFLAAHPLKQILPQFFRF